MAYDEHVATLGGEVKEKETATPKTREQRIADWRQDNAVAYKVACEDRCTCTPSRAQMLLLQQWDSPPID